MFCETINSNFYQEVTYVYNSNPSATVLLLNPPSRKKSLLVESYSPKPQKKNPKRAKSSQLALANGMKMASTSRWMSKKAIRFLFAKYAGTEIKVDGKKLLILRESDLLAIVLE